MNFFLNPHRNEHPAVNLLKRLPAFSQVPDAELASLAQLSDQVDLQAGYTLMRTGQFGREAFVLLEGEVEVQVDGRKVARLTAGDVVGELALLDPRQPRNATVVATTDVKALVMDPRSYRSLRDRPGLDHVLVRAERYTPTAA